MQYKRPQVTIGILYGHIHIRNNYLKYILYFRLYRNHKTEEDNGNAAGFS